MEIFQNMRGRMVPRPATKWGCTDFSSCKLTGPGVGVTVVGGGAPNVSQAAWKEGRQTEGPAGEQHALFLSKLPCCRPSVIFLGSTKSNCTKRAYAIDHELR